jgi:hypothetical protein
MAEARFYDEFVMNGPFNCDGSKTHLTTGHLLPGPGKLVTIMSSGLIFRVHFKEISRAARTAS